MSYLVALAILFFVLTATPARTFVVEQFNALRTNQAVTATIAKGANAAADLRASIADRVQSWIRIKAHQELDKTLDRELK